MLSAWTFFGGVADIFISLMLWFIFSEDQVTHLIRHSEKSYPVLDIIVPNERLSINSAESDSSNANKALAGRESVDSGFSEIG